MNQTIGLKEEVGVVDRVAQATRIFLATAIGLGFVSSALALFLFPADGNGGGTRPAAPVQMKVAQVVSATTLLDRDQQFIPMDYTTPGYILYRQNSITTGTPVNKFTINKTLQMEANTAAINANVGQFPFTGSPAQMTVIEYRLAGDSALSAPRRLTICLGSTSSTKFYVATDGSTYTTLLYGQLTNRTTAEPCSTTIQRALKTTTLTAGRMTAAYAAWPTDQAYDISRGVDTTLGQLDPLNGFQSGTGKSNPADGFPLGVVARANQGTAEEDLPASFVVLSTNDLSSGPKQVTLCMPSMVIPGDLFKPVTYYFANDGTAYSDIFLTQLVVDYGEHFSTCSNVLARTLKYSQVTAGTLITEKPTDIGLAVTRSGILMAGFDGTIFHAEGTVPSTSNTFDPVTITPTTSQLAAGYPEAIMTLTGADTYPSASPSDNYTTTLCIPSKTWESQDPKAHGFFYDKNGTPFNDIFLGDKAVDVNCSDIISRGYSPAKITNVTMAPTMDTDHGIMAVSGSYLYGVVGADGWHDRQGQQGLYQGYPLALALTGADTAVTIPKITVGVTDSTGVTKNLCWGGWANIKASDRVATVVYDKNGNGFTDLFMTMPYTCPPTYSNIRVISSTTSSATIGWDTDIPTCGRINYGTVSGQLNSGPVGDTCASTVPGGTPFTTGHQATLTGLTAATKYFYQIVGGSDSAPQQSFTTPAAGTGGTPIKLPVSKLVQ